MSKIRESTTTTCERKFLIKCLTDSRRIDGRSFEEFRSVNIAFGKDYGNCCVSLGNTIILAQTSCEIQLPKSSRPSEGILNINIELNPLAAPHFEAGRQTELCTQLNRLLEKCVKDSKAIDLESLCIKTNEKVWALRVDLNVLNHEGNILDCASIALLASLMHFRHPDVTCDGEDFKIHGFHERDPIPIVVHHYPLYISYSIFNGGEYILADANLIEENSADATLTIGLNSFKELCGLHLGGNAELNAFTILGTVSKASARANILVEEIKASVRKDTELREKNVTVGFHDKCNVLTLPRDLSVDCWQQPTKTKKKAKQKRIELQSTGKKSTAPAPHSGDFKEHWVMEDSDDDVMIIETPRISVKVRNSDSEEEEVMVLEN